MTKTNESKKEKHTDYNKSGACKDNSHATCSYHGCLCACHNPKSMAEFMSQKDSPSPKSWEEDGEFMHYASLIYKYCRKIGSNPKDSLSVKEDFKQFISHQREEVRKETIKECLNATSGHCAFCEKELKVVSN